MNRPPRVSVAIPLFNEESVLPELYQRVMGVLDDLPGGPHQVVFVDDGSGDGTAELLEAYALIDPRVFVIRLSRNFGHQAALSAALDHVSGDVVICMDGDLQDTPESIPRFLEAFGAGADVVYAVRQQRKENWLMRFFYGGFYRVITALADIPLPTDAGDFGLMSRRVVDVVRASGERHRYLRGLRTWAGFRQVGVPVERVARHAGRSKYSLRKLLKLAFDGIFAFSVMPLRFATMIGGFAIVASFLFAGYSLFAKLVLDQSPTGFTALYVSMTFLAGVQLLFLGVIGEYVGRTYEEVKQRPLYVVDRLLHVEAARGTALHVGETTPVRDRSRVLHDERPLVASNHE